MTTSKSSANSKKTVTAPANTGVKTELSTDIPLSEKDEVKRAEQKMNKAAKKNS
jgi:hypothetical protein